MSNPSAYLVTAHEGRAANTVAEFLAALLQRNFDSHPERVAVAKRIPRPITVVSPDVKATATVVFGDEGAVVYNDVVGRPCLTLTGTVPQIVEVAQLKGTPAVLKSVLGGRPAVQGLFSHTRSALKFISIVSAA